MYSELRIKHGDLVLIKGKRKRETLALALSDTDTTDGKVRMNKVARNNLRVKLGGHVSITNAGDVAIGKAIHVQPFADTLEGVSDDLLTTFLKPYFKDGRPLKRGLLSRAIV